MASAKRASRAKGSEGAGGASPHRSSPVVVTSLRQADARDAAVGVIYGRTSFEIGLRLMAVGRDTEKALVDIPE